MCECEYLSVYLQSVVVVPLVDAVVVAAIVDDAPVEAALVRGLLGVIDTHFPLCRDLEHCVGEWVVIKV